MFPDILYEVQKEIDWQSNFFVKMAGILVCSTNDPLLIHLLCPLRLHTRITVHAQTAAQQQSDGNFEARMSKKCREWRD